MLAEPIFQFTEELSASSKSVSVSSVGSCGNATNGSSGNSRVIPPLRASLKRPSKLELKINLNDQQTESRSPLNPTAMSMHLQSSQNTATNCSNTINNTISNNIHSHDRNNNFLNNTKQSNK